MELTRLEKFLIIDGLEESIKNKEDLARRGILVNEMQEDIDELNSLINKIKATM